MCRLAPPLAVLLWFLISGGFCVLLLSAVSLFCTFNIVNIVNIVYRGLQYRRYIR